MKMPKVIQLKTKQAIQKAYFHYKSDRPDLSRTEILCRLTDIFEVRILEVKM